ncbi:zinc-binding dehydrogenase [Streptomyces sp. WSLK1-3]|uniref:zinc-binding dehydrogenase n=1 Tax=Streptomyces sp. WSLK1-3 TaxID=3375475 RepID=UPI00378BFBAA
MQQLTFVSPGKLEWRDVPAPALRNAAEALVRPVASSTCDLDHLIISGQTPFQGPFPIGHECVAEVVDIGDGVRHVRPGQLVVLPWHINCGACAQCRTGRPALCQSTPPAASYGIPSPSGEHWGGTFDELVRVPYADAMLVPVPEDMDHIALVAAGDNMTIALEFTAGHLHRNKDARVLVLAPSTPSGGSVALFAVEMMRSMGASRITYVDDDAARRSMAAMLGASVESGPLRRELGVFDLVFDGSLDSARLAQAFRLVAPGGSIESAGGHFGKIEVDLLRMYTLNVGFHMGIANAGMFVRDAIDRVRQGRVRPGIVLGDATPMDDAAQSLLEPAVKPVFVRDRIGPAR